MDKASGLTTIGIRVWYWIQMQLLDDSIFSTISEILIFLSLMKKNNYFLVCIVLLLLLISVCRRFLYALLSRANLS